MAGPSPTRNSTNLSIYPLSLGKTGLGSGGPGAPLEIPGPSGLPGGGNGGGTEFPEGFCWPNDEVEAAGLGPDLAGDEITAGVDTSVVDRLTVNAVVEEDARGADCIALLKSKVKICQKHYTSLNHFFTLLIVKQ